MAIVTQKSRNAMLNAAFAGLRKEQRASKSEKVEAPEPEAKKAGKKKPAVKKGAKR